ncbi:hypothetical protein AB0E18_29960, partial [Streptomyces sp. NPDC047968]
TPPPEPPARCGAARTPVVRYSQASQLGPGWRTVPKRSAVTQVEALRAVTGAVAAWTAGL